MKHLLLTSLFLLVILISGNAQDKIITWKNDTINCKVIRNSGHYIHFQIEQNGFLTKGKLNRSEVRELSISSPGALPSSTGTTFNQWRLAFSGGLGYQIGDTDDGRDAAKSLGLTNAQIDDYYKQILLGWQAGANVHYFLNTDIAVGVNYHFFSSGANIWATFDPQDGVNLYHGKMIEAVLINYVGGSLFSKNSLAAGDKLWFTSVVSAGLVFYRDEATILESNILMTGNAFGATADLGMEYFVAPKVSIGLGLGLFVSKIKKIKIDDGYNSTTHKLDTDEQENLSRIDLSAGLRFYF